MRNGMIVVLGVLALVAGSMATAGTYDLIPIDGDGDDDLYDLNHRWAVEWGFRFDTPENEEIIGASLFFDRIRNDNNDPNDLYVTLLDSDFEGLDWTYDNQGGGDLFAGQGLLLEHYEDLPSSAQDITYDFDDAEIDQLIANLADDLAGIGFDADCHYYNCGIKLTIETDTSGGGEDDPVVPEPAGLGLMGLALLAVRRRRS